jgi:hypothetical protein
MKKFSVFLSMIFAITFFPLGTAFALSTESWSDTWTATGYEAYFPFNTIQHFEIKNGGVSDWEIGKKDGSPPALANEDFVLNSGVDYFFTVTHNSSSGDIKLEIGGADLTWDTGIASFSDLWFFVKDNRTDSQSVSIKKLKLNSSQFFDLTGNWGEGLHLYGESFADFTIEGQINFIWSGSVGNSDMGAFIGWSNTTNPIPEPTTILLLGIGLIGLAGIGRKRLIKK